MTQQYVTREELMEALTPLVDGINRMAETQERILEGQTLMLGQLGEHTGLLNQQAALLNQHTELLESIVSTLQDHSALLASIEARLDQRRSE